MKLDKSLEEKGTKGVSINTKNNNVIHVDPESSELGFVGVPKKIDANVIKKILNENLILIIKINYFFIINLINSLSNFIFY